MLLQTRSAKCHLFVVFNIKHDEMTLAWHQANCSGSLLAFKDTEEKDELHL